MSMTAELIQAMQYDINTALALIAPDFKASYAIILGSGLRNFSDEMTILRTISYQDLPHFKPGQTKGHDGNLILGHLGSVPIVCLQGRMHWYEGREPSDFIGPFLTLKRLGVTQVLITNASGAINEIYKPGELVLVNDHINFQFRSPLVGLSDPEGRHFLDMQKAYDNALNDQLIVQAKKLNIPLHRGIYMGVLGPNFETPAEIRAFRRLGADLVGMSTLPEVMMAHYFKMNLAVIAVLSNMAAGVTDQTLSHELTLAVAQQGASQLTHLIRETIKQ